ncbi:Receptor expression-enhancing protein 5, partial [Fragariocoptes setiger]
MSQYYQQFVNKLEQYLNDNNSHVAKLLGKAEEVTKVKRVYIAQGLLGIIGLYMIIGHFAEFICNSIGFVYPAYQSLMALETHHKDDDTKWLTYWVVFAAFSVVEFFSDIIFSWFPFYWLAKVVFLIWCFLPSPNNGASVIYGRIIRPVFLRRRQQISDAVGKASGIAQNYTSSQIIFNKDE